MSYTKEQLATAIAENDCALMRHLADEWHPVDYASALSTVHNAAHVWQALSCLSQEARAAIFGYLPNAVQAELALRLRRGQLADLFAYMSSDDRADLYNQLTEDQQQALLPGLAQAERNDIRRLASYPEGTVGAVMTSDYATLPQHLNAGQAIEHLRREAPDKETIYDAYVVDESRRLLGVVSLRDLILARPAELLVELMTTEFIAAAADEPRADAAQKIARYDLIALPVVDAEQKLIGIVTYDDAMDVVEAETTEDFLKGANVGTFEERFSEVGLFTLYKKRVFWLVLLVFGNIFSSAGIAYYEDTIARYVALVFFLPLLIGSGGNAGAQAAMLANRAMATGDIAMKDWAKMLVRELAVAGALAVTMAAAVAVIGVAKAGVLIAMVVSFSMVIIVLSASILGLSLPFLLSRCRLDPAAASAPVITTIADALGVLIYFMLATMILPMH